ncbi:MAG: NifU family protein [Planctomycetes bacterium]|nr:NifU family protein [Planctomycetota bacterium]NUQ35500.1 NifU family protein [Planctomycetaceae bacterium]
MWCYSEIAVSHYLAPRNHHSIAEPTIVAEAYDRVSGDRLKLFLTLDDKDIIEDAGYRIEGNQTCLASTSLLSELLLNRHMEAAAKISPDQLRAGLDELPEEQLNQPVLGIRAFRNAYDQWRARRDPRGKLLCYCLSVPWAQVEDAVRAGYYTTIEQVGQATMAGTGCASCHPDIISVIDGVQKEREHDFDRRQRSRTLQKTLPEADRRRLDKIEDVLAREIRPGIRLDGGDIDLVGLSGNVVTVSLSGACRSCSSSTATLRYAVELKLRELVDPALEVAEA